MGLVSFWVGFIIEQSCLSRICIEVVFGKSPIRRFFDRIKSMEKIKLICFDVDETLVDGTSWLMLTEGLSCSSREHLDIFRRCQKGEITFTEGERLSTKMYQNSDNANKDFISNLFDSVKIKSETIDLISYLKEKGYKVYLISGAIDIYVESIAKKLGVNGFYANSTLEFDNEGILQKINYRNNQGEIKVEQLRSLVKDLGISIKQVVFVGDSENDIEVFKATEHGIAVHSPSEELNKIAWKKVNSLKEIRKIL